MLSGRYRLVRPIARGGVADVWEGHDQVLSRDVAIKVLQRQFATDEVFLERFRREAVAAARLAHPGVVATFDAGVDGSTTYIVMELVRGDTLRESLSERGRLPSWLAIGITAQITEALVHAHRAGIIHRDVKPANILLCEDGGDVPRVKVTDFGIAKAAEGLGMDLTRTGMVVGTPRYLSPEQVQGFEPDARADLYALGVVAFEMLTGRSPFEGDTEMTMALARLDQPAPRVRGLCPEVPRPVDALVADLLATEPERRTPSAMALRLALADAQASLSDPGPSAGRGAALAGGVAGPGMTPTRGRRFGRRRRKTPVTGSPVTGSPEPTPDPAWPTDPGTPGPGAAATPGLGAAVRRPLPSPLAAPPSPDRAGTGRLPAPGPTARMTPTRVEGRTQSEYRAHLPTERDVAATDRPSPGGSVSRAPATAAPAGTGTPAGATKRRRRSRGPGLVVGVVAVAAVVVAVLLLGGQHRSPGGTSGSGGAASVGIAGVTVWIVPPQRTPDNPAEVRNTYDANPQTSWSTVDYKSRNFGGFGGEGLAIELDGAHPLHRLSVESPTTGWTAATYVSAGRAQSLVGWGPATAQRSGINGATTFDLGGRTGRWVLLWMTYTGPGMNIQINEVKVS